MIKAKIYSILWLLGCIYFFLFSDSFLALFLLITSLAVFAVCKILTVLTKKKLSFELKVQHTAAKGKPAKGVLAVKNTSLFPAARVRCVLTFYNCITREEQEAELYFSIMGGKTEEIDWEADSAYCGCIRIRIKDARVFDWFGIFSAPVSTEVQEQVAVLPDMFQSDIRVMDSQIEDMESVTYSDTKRGYDPSEIFDVREYIPGDSLKNIHWKLSGKMDELYVKELSMPVENSILIFMENCMEEGKRPRPSVVDGMIEAFVSVSQSLIEEGHMHTLGWYDHIRGGFFCEEVNSVDDLAGLLGGLLGVGVEDNGYSGLHYYTQVSQEYPFSHIVYVTFRDTAEIEEVGSFCIATELRAVAKTEDAVSMPEKQRILFTPEHAEESLCQLFI